MGTDGIVGMDGDKSVIEEWAAWMAQIDSVLLASVDGWWHKTVCQVQHW